MKKILLIEDSPHVRENTAEIMELGNYKVVSAGNGSDGLVMAVHEKPDLVVCDIALPQMDGYEVLRSIRASESTKDIPFIFLTCSSEKQDIRKGMELGADAYITKPFDGAELIAAITKCLAKQRAATLPKSSRSEYRGIPSQLLSNAPIVNYKKKAQVYVENGRADSFFYVRRGRVRTYRHNDDGKELIVDLLKKGDLFGYIALFNRLRYMDSAQAIDQTELAVISRQQFEQWLISEPKAAHKILGMLAEKIDDLEARLAIVAYSSVRKKVASALLQVIQKYPGNIRMSRENLARLAGTATESLIRTLAQFKSEHMIAVKKSSIVILDETRLKKLVE